MSSYLDVVIHCDLRPETPQEYINAIRYLTSPKGTVPLPSKPDTIIKSEYDDAYDFWDLLRDTEPFLEPQPKHGIISNFYQLRDFHPTEHMPVDFYCLQYVGRKILDDVWANGFALFFYWLPTIASDGFVGYTKDQYNNELSLLYVKNGRGVDQDGNLLHSEK